MGDAVGKEEVNVNPSLVHMVTLVYGRILVIDIMQETIIYIVYKYILCGGKKTLKEDGIAMREVHREK